LAHNQFSYAPVHFALAIDIVLQTIFPGWSQTMIPLTLTSQVARILGMSHKYLLFSFIFFVGHSVISNKWMDDISIEMKSPILFSQWNFVGD
jgi:hypothetical protein